MISPYQGFWVKANNPNPALSFTSEVLTTGGIFYGGFALKSQQISPAPSALSLNLSSAGLESDIMVSFNTEGKIGPDTWDAYRLEPLSNSAIEFFTVSSPAFTMPLVINNLPSDVPEWINLPLYVGGKLGGQQLGGNYEMNWELPPDWPSDWAITLNDHTAKKAISMRRNHTYAFTLGVTNPSIKAGTEVGTGAGTEGPMKAGDERAAGGLRASGDAVPPLPPSIINPVSVSSMLKSSTQLPPFSIVIEKGTSKDDPVYFAPEASLFQNYPNPFRDHTTIRFSLPLAAYVTLKVYDIYGKMLYVVADRQFETGIYTMQWNRNNFKPGVYLLQMHAGDIVKTVKMVVI